MLSLNVGLKNKGDFKVVESSQGTADVFHTS